MPDNDRGTPFPPPVSVPTISGPLLPEGRRAMPRKRVARRAVVGAALVCASATMGSVQPSAEAAEQPDIVLIVTDDQRADTLRWMPVVRRQLVGRGVTFTNAMVPTSTCCPSRASLLTGLFAHHRRVVERLHHERRPDGWVGELPSQPHGASVGRRVARRRRLSNDLRRQVPERLRQTSSWLQPPRLEIRRHLFAGSHAEYYDYRLVHTNGRTTRFGGGRRETIRPTSCDDMPSTRYPRGASGPALVPSVRPLRSPPTVAACAARCRLRRRP